MTEYFAFEVAQNDHIFSRGIVPKQSETLKENQVLVSIDYSTINYKDALAATKNGGVIRDYPKTPGIDLAGTVVESNSDKFAKNDRVLATGFGLGVEVNGGWSQMQVVPEEWLLKIPTGLSAQEAMTFGTAAVTAAMIVSDIDKRGIDPQAAIYVTGASGGVGSFALILLQELGYTNLVAISRKQETHLNDLKDVKVLSPEAVVPEKVKPLNSQTIAILIDTVGSDLAGLLPQIKQNGIVYACGNAGGNELTTTVLPFILRGIQLIGIDSVNVDLLERESIWQFLAAHKAVLKRIPCQKVRLPEIDAVIATILEGTHTGRTIIDLGVKK